MQQDMQQLSQIYPAGGRQYKAKEVGFFMVSARLPRYCVDPRQREPKPKKRHEQAEALRPREDARRAS